MIMGSNYAAYAHLLHGSMHPKKPPQLSEHNLVISALSEKKRSIRAPQSATIGDASSGDNIFYETIR